MRFSPSASRARPLAARASQAGRRHVRCSVKLISKSEISPFIPRSDLMGQMYRWAELEVKNDGVANFGIACEVEFVGREDEPWAFIVHMERVRHHLSSKH
jgi:hypothetical protein